VAAASRHAQKVPCEGRTSQGPLPGSTACSAALVTEFDEVGLPPTPDLRFSSSPRSPVTSRVLPVYSSGRWSRAQNQDSVPLTKSLAPRMALRSCARPGCPAIKAIFGYPGEPPVICSNLATGRVWRILREWLTRAVSAWSTWHENWQRSRRRTVPKCSARRRVSVDLVHMTSSPGRS
jgi:hypothetical protein